MQINLRKEKKTSDNKLPIVRKLYFWHGKKNNKIKANMLEGILSISGQSGLYKLITQAKNGIIVESFDTQKRMPVYSNAKVSALEDIAIFTSGEEVPLKDVFKKIYTVENKKATSVSKKASNDEIKEYFEDILPEYDKDRVYVSDMKKVITWYNVLLEKGLMNFDEKAEEAKTEEAAKEEKTTEAKPKATKAAPKTAAKPVAKVKADAKPKPSKATSPKTIQRKSN